MTPASPPYLIVVGVNYSTLSLLALQTALRVAPPHARSEGPRGLRRAARGARP